MPQAEAPITFVIPGVRQDGASRSGGTPAPAHSGPGHVKARVQVAARRSGDAVRVTAVPGEDVVVLHIAGGPALTLHPATAAALMRGQGGTTRSGARAAGRDSGEVQVSAELRWQGLEQAAPSRSGGFLGQVLLSAFEVVTGLVRDQAVDFVASAVVKKVDGQVEAGVYTLSPEALTPLKGSGKLLATVPAPADPATQPLLVLIHGTFVDTVSTFGKMWVQHPQAVRDLFTHYGQRVYALDHPTIGASPIANALTLVQALPEGARLHLATHSRGGLVAEVLARVCARPTLTPDDLAHFDGPAYEQQRQDLRALAGAVKKKGITVDRVVRVACPARGTLLASERLDAYLSVLKWTLELAAVPVAPTLLDFLSEVARRRADPAELPGLAAMIPDAPLLNWLNGTEEPIAGELRVVAGDLQGDSVGTWLKTLLADAFYWTDNDIVVHTRSMYGGAPRLGGAQFLLDQGGKVTHFAYFANERTVQAVVAGLTQAQPPGFGLIGPLSWAGQDSGGTRAANAARAARDGRPASERPAVFVLPGILGSHLRVGDKRIWLSLRLIGGLSKLRYEPGRADGVQPDGPIGLSYDDLIEHLADTHEVFEFSYDWRRPIEEEARRLAEAVTAALDARNASGQPVRLLAHSMGGVVARTMQLERPQVWARLMQRPGARLVMLGTPNGGSWAPMQCLSGDDTFGNALASFGSPLRDKQARQWMAEMPGFIQLQAGLLDQGLDQESKWRALAEADLKFVEDRNWWHTSNGENPEAAYTWGVPPQRVLDQARALRERLDKQRDGDLKTFADKLALVVGRAKFTPDGYAVGDQGFVYQDAVDGGDGRVTLGSALLPGVRTWTLDTEHGSLPDKESAFDAFVELLERGETARLTPLAAPTAPARSGGAVATLPTVVHVSSRPSRARSLPVPATGQQAVFLQGRMEDTGPQRPRAAALQVTVLNGNLSFVRTPLMVGHSRSLILTGTEGAVNRLIGGAMKASLEAGLYPDEPGSHQIFMNARQDPENPWAAPRPGAVVVVGLGDEGKLSEERLTRTVRQGVMAWAQRQAEAPGGAPAHMELAATLMGSGGSGMNASNAARAIAQGVRDANLRLAAGNSERGWPVVTKLTLVELYLERASDAWHGLQVLATAAPGDFDIAPTIASGVGPLRRQIDSGYRGADYDFITATSASDDTIAFTLDTKRARTEVRAQTTQGKLLRELVSKASRDSNTDAQLGRTLFQLLVPPEVEPFLSGTSRMLLELDEKTAPIPWELLDTQPERQPRPGQSAERPWAIRTQLLRKLRKETYRQQVQDADPDDSVLVIGEPLCTDDRYARLPGAAREARAVAAKLRETGAVAADRVNALLEQPTASQVINALFERRYRIVHIAGHGEPVLRDEKDRSKIIHKGGVVLSDGTFLGPDEVRSMRTVPELVFVNCCHLAAPDEQEALKAKRRGPFDRADFAYGLADALIETGVRCVIAAGWAVDDGPAEVFATTFYAQLLNRQPFITAVARAREAAWLANPRSNTWAAYQCYGDPNWTYRQSAADALAAPLAPRDEFDGIASPLGLALALEEVVVQRRYMGAPRATQLEKVRHLDARFAGLWGGMGAIAEALALGYQEGGETDTAIAWYEKAIRSNDGSSSMRAQEQLGNLRARRAWDRVRDAKDAQLAAVAATSRAELMQAVRELSLLANLLPTLERHSLVGSAHKRLALLESRLGDAAGEAAQLDAARTAYRSASTLAVQDASPELFYPAMNELAIDLVLQAAARRATLDTVLLEGSRRSLQHKAQHDPDFWCYAGLIEIDLLQALADRQLAAAADRLLDRYAELHTRVGSRGYWTTVADQGHFLLTPHARHHAGAEATQARRLLDWLNERAGRTAGAA
jgi:CHAT domain-containing protein